MDGLIIREAKPQEADLITGFQVAMAYETENITLDEDILKAGVQAVFKAAEKGSYYVAESTGNIIACMLTTYEWSDWRNGTFIWLQSVYVRPAWRARGVFRKMYDHITQIVSASQQYKGIRLYVFHTNTKAQSVYRSVGMEDPHYRMFEWLKG